MGIFNKRKSSTQEMLDKLEDFMEGGWDDTSWSYVTNAPLRRTTPKPPPDPIETATDDVLILELVKRGYAVAKMTPDELVAAAK
jgi:hypothetical protein